MSNAVAKISLKFDLEHVELNSFDGKINELVYFENNKPSLELENIDFEGNLKQGHAAINSVTKVGPSLNTYRDIKVEFSSTGNVEREKEITLSLKSNISDLISLLPKTKHDLTRITSLIRSQGEKKYQLHIQKQ